MNALAQAISITWQRNRDYALRLVGGIPHADLINQPLGWNDPDRVMNHPAWVLSHLTLYAGIAGLLIRGSTFPDPIDDRFGQRSAPLSDIGVYPLDLVERFRGTHDATGLLLQSATDDSFNRPLPIERWRALHPTTGDMLVTLMVKHEAGHLGQLSAWRRAMGLPPVAQ